MPDVPSAQDAAASLQTAKNSGGQVFLTEIARLTAAGAVISPQDAELAATLQGFRANLAGSTLPAGPSDQRSPAQVEFDQRNGYNAGSDGREFYVAVPPALQGKDTGDTIAAARDVAAKLSLGIDSGNNLIADAFRTITKLEAMSPDDRQAQKELWIKQSRQVWGDEALEGISKEIDAFLTAIFPQGNALLERLSNAGGLVDPQVIADLRHAMVAANSRPRS